jgi:hypothetical protein
MVFDRSDGQQAHIDMGFKSKKNSARTAQPYAQIKTQARSNKCAVNGLGMPSRRHDESRRQSRCVAVVYAVRVNISLIDCAP